MFVTQILILIFSTSIASAMYDSFDSNAHFAPALAEISSEQNAAFEKEIQSINSEFNVTTDINQLMAEQNDILKQLNQISGPSQLSSMPTPSLVASTNPQDILASQYAHLSTSSLTENLTFNFQRADYMPPAQRANQTWDRINQANQWMSPMAPGFFQPNLLSMPRGLR